MTSQFSLEIEFKSGLTSTQQAAFADARDRWREVIVGALTPVVIDGQQIDGLVIEAQGVVIDGPGQVLGQAGPTAIRNGSMLPAKGIMSFDTADLARMETDGSLTDVILHEMGHVLGLGTLWDSNFFDFVVGSGTSNPNYSGGYAKTEYANLLNDGTQPNIPLANQGGAGTAEGHWRESTFAHELMTGFLSGLSRPLSRMTIAALKDLGYEVDMSAADHFDMPGPSLIAMVALTAPATPCCRVLRPEPVMIQEVEPA